MRHEHDEFVPPMSDDALAEHLTEAHEQEMSYKGWAERDFLETEHAELHRLGERCSYCHGKGSTRAMYHGRVTDLSCLPCKGTGWIKR